MIEQVMRGMKVSLSLSLSLSLCVCVCVSLSLCGKLVDIKYEISKNSKYFSAFFTLPPKTKKPGLLIYKKYILTVNISINVQIIKYNSLSNARKLINWPFNER